MALNEIKVLNDNSETSTDLEFKPVTGTDLGAGKTGLDVAMIGDTRVTQAINQILGTTGDTVSVQKKAKSLFKFGHSEQVQSGQYCTLMDLPTGTYNEVYLTDNLITTISSASAADTQVVQVEGHTLAGGNFTFVTQEVTLTGQTQASLGTPLARCTRFYNKGSVDFAGDIYVYEDDTSAAGVPDTDAGVHCMLYAVNATNQSLKCSTTLSSQDYWIVTQAFAAINQKAGSPIAEVRIEIREYGGVFRTAGIATISTGGGPWTGFSFDPAIIVPKNADIRMRAKGSANGLNISGWFNGYLAIVL